MTDFSKIYRYLRILSIDIVLGACASALFISHYLNIDIPVLSLVALGISVWAIYTTDHLIDAYLIKHRAHSLRHLFHQRNFTYLVYSVIMAITVTIILLFFLPVKMVIWGAILLGLVLVHFLTLKLVGVRASLHKEFLVAIIYVSGIFLIPLSIFEGAWDFHIGVLYIEFFVVALVNLLLFALIEEEIDTKDGHTSFVKFAGPRNTTILIFGLLAISFIYPIYSIISFDHHVIVYQLVILSMSLTLLIITLKKEYFMIRERYRIYGDLIFLYPLVVLLQ